MSVILGTLVLGVSFLADDRPPGALHLGHAHRGVADRQVRLRARGAFGHLLYLALQASTMFILVLAANTSFTGFPFLASFAAEDSYLPRQLNRRGHRLVFSTGIIVLTVVSVALLLVTRARVDSLIPLYAIGVFTGFTMAGAGMVKYHLTPPGAALAAQRADQRRGRRALVHRRHHLRHDEVHRGRLGRRHPPARSVSSSCCACTASTPRRTEQLEVGVLEACEAPVLRRHVVVVLVDALDLATARAIQYARTLQPDELRVVHFAVDPTRRASSSSDWSSLGLSRLPLDVIECPDRRLTRAALELAAEITATGRPSSPSCCPGGASPRAGAGCCTTAPPTGSPPPCASCPTSTPPSSRST